MLQDVFAFAALPVAAAVVLTGMHTWLGLQVLRRNVVFADLALAQLSALGATVATAAGHAGTTLAGHVYTFIFAAAGALLLTASRALARSVRQEAFIGVLYVVATAATVLVVDRSPQGAEHVKKMLVGSILSVSSDELLKLVILYGSIGILHWLARRPLLAAADPSSQATRMTLFWDLMFYLSFGVVVTSSVSVAGVLLVFCFLIVPALIGTLFSSRAAVVLALGWIAGAGASTAGILGSFLLDAPTGAVAVIAFAATLLLALGVRAFVTAPKQERDRHRASAMRAGALGVCAGAALSGMWAMFAPSADHPVLAAFEMATGLGPEYYLSERERLDYLDAAVVEGRHRAEIDRLNRLERSSRWQGQELGADEVRHIASVQQSLTEMGRGERFVLEYLRALARERERWYVGLPLAIIGMAGLAGIATSAARSPQR
ncbi:MAG: metal ABC transporter permease [Xanthobacteraceae bacterium]